MLKAWEPITVYARTEDGYLRILKRYFPETAMMGYELQEYIPAVTNWMGIVIKKGYWKTITFDSVNWGYEQGWVRHYNMTILDENGFSNARITQLDRATDF